jgi:uncharacterized Zn-binding protein involved in type VI secretion
MPPVARKSVDVAFVPACVHGKPCCPHPASGPASAGSPDTLVNGQPVVRVGDSGKHAACCGPNSWVAQMGSGTVRVNNIPVHRLGDMTVHCGGVGYMAAGSANVIIGG